MADASGAIPARTSLHPDAFFLYARRGHDGQDLTTQRKRDVLPARRYAAVAEECTAGRAQPHVHLHGIQSQRRGLIIGRIPVLFGRWQIPGSAQEIKAQQSAARGHVQRARITGQRTDFVKRRDEDAVFRPPVAGTCACSGKASAKSRTAAVRSITTVQADRTG